MAVGQGSPTAPAGDIITIGSNSMNSMSTRFAPAFLAIPRVLKIADTAP